MSNEINWEREDSARGLLSLIEASVSPYHMVQEGIRLLREAGFCEWSLNSTETLLPGEGYYTNLYGTTLAAFRMPEKAVSDKDFKGFRIAAAHTDNPCFRVKPNPDHRTSLYHKLNVEAYGGAIRNTWLDRPLLIAGRLCLRGDDPFSPREVLYSSGKPVAVIPNLAIHMNREVNQGVALKVQTDMEALLTYAGPAEDGQSSLLERISGELHIPKEEILDYDLYLNSAEPGIIIGYEGELIQAPRLDNLTSCQSCLHGLLANESMEDRVSLIVLFDNEECGSRSKQGADSVVLSALLEKIMICGGNESRMDFLNRMLESFVVSLDVAHATHPNHPEKADPTHPVPLDAGVVMKLSTNQRYATDCSAVSVVEAICRDKGIPCRKFVNHGDIPGGGTLGSILSSTVPAKTVDIGVPLLGMHSCRELMAASSQRAMNHFMEAYLKGGC